VRLEAGNASGHQGLDPSRSSSNRAGHAAVGRHQHRSRSAPRTVGVGDLVLALDHGNRHLIRMQALPVGDVGGERLTGAALRIREDEQRRLSQGQK
jgi:hypothetical protein